MTETLTQPGALTWTLDLGANYHPSGTTAFKVWAPHHLSLLVEIEGKGRFKMQKQKQGYFTYETDTLSPGDSYTYVLENGLKRPDPVSRSLPQGVHGATEIVDAYAFPWTDSHWKGLPLRECIFYETHVGTFTPEGTFDGMIEKLPYLKKLGVTCLEIMPLAQFPGRWNWGYDGASIYAPYSGYGGVAGFKRFVNACHQVGIAVCLDVVYNHLGPEGNYLGEFGHYFSGTYHTPWGKAFNYDGAHSDPVRDYIIKNALHWIVEYHIDGLRLDAIHGIYDFSASPMLPELIEEVSKLKEALGREIHVVAESGLNDARVIRERDVGGVALCGLWNDDYHHAAHVALTGEQGTYYKDFDGLADLAKALTKGFIYDGQYSEFRRKRHGNSSFGIPFEKLIIFLQNHDQTGNRPLGERLSTLISKERLKVAAFLLFMTPATPLLFMGEEYGEVAPFEYFVDYQNERLMRSIFEGRKREFHRNDMPFPGKESFNNSCLTWKQDPELLELYTQLIALRKTHLPKEGVDHEGIQVYYSPEEDWLAWEYETEEGWVGVALYLGSENAHHTLTLPFKQLGNPRLLLASSSVVQKGDQWVFPTDSAAVFH